MWICFAGSPQILEHETIFWSQPSRSENVQAKGCSRQWFAWQFPSVVVIAVFLWFVNTPKIPQHHRCSTCTYLKRVEVWGTVQEFQRLSLNVRVLFQKKSFLSTRGLLLQTLWVKAECSRELSGSWWDCWDVEIYCIWMYWIFSSTSYLLNCT